MAKFKKGDKFITNVNINSMGFTIPKGEMGDILENNNDHPWVRFYDNKYNKYKHSDKSMGMVNCTYESYLDHVVEGNQNSVPVSKVKPIQSTVIQGKPEKKVELHKGDSVLVRVVVKEINCHGNVTWEDNPLTIPTRLFTDPRYEDIEVIINKKDEAR